MHKSAIKLPRIESLPQKISPSFSKRILRDASAHISKAADGNIIDAVSGVKAVTAIPGIRYGIVNGVVTEFAVNQPAIEDNGLRACPAFTQLAKYSEDLTNAAWSRGYVLSPVQDDMFQGIKTWFFAESTDTGVHTALRQASALSGLAINSVVGFSFIFKSSNRKILASIIDKNNVFLTAMINNETGAVESVSTGLNVSVQSLSEGFFRVFISASVGSGPYDAVGRVNICYNDLNSYTGDGVSGISIGQPTYINFGVNGIPFIPPYTPNNTGSAVSAVSETATSTAGMSFDLDNSKLINLKNALRGPNGQGHLEVDWTPGFNSAWLPSGVALTFSILNVSDNSSHPLSFRQDTSNNCVVRFSDSTSVAGVPIITIAGKK